MNHAADTRARRPTPHSLVAAALALALVALSLSPAAGARAEEGVAAQGVAANLVMNWSFETFEGRTVYDRVGQYWDVFVLSGDSVEFRQGTQFAGVNVERIDGRDSQIIKSDEPFDAGVYQVVTGLQPNQWYSALAYILTIYQTSAVEDPRDFDGTMVKQIGVDPTGGRNPLSSSVIWGEPVDKNMDRDTWGHRLTFQATGYSATLYIRVQALQGVSYEAYDNLAFIDGAQLRLAPVSQAIVPDTAPAGPFEVKWQSVVPNAWATEARVISHDVEYRDGLGPWQRWLTQTTTGGQEFGLVVPGHEYSFRVRAWAQYASRFAEMPGPWAESAPVRLGRVIEATALDNRGNAVAGVPFELRRDAATVACAVTDGAGRAYLAGEENVPYQVIARDTWFRAPPAVHNVVIGPGISPVAVTVMPPDDVVLDGSFEGATTGEAPPGWSASGPMARVTDYRYHTGVRSVELATDMDYTGVCLAAVFDLEDTYLPTLSFWYRLLPGEGGMAKVLRVQIRDPSQLVLAETSLQSQTDTDWQSDHLPITEDERLYTGQVTVEFCLLDPGGATTYGTVRAYLDDVSLGSASGGPVKSYLPLTTK